MKRSFSAKSAILLAGAGLAMQAGAAQAKVSVVCPIYDRGTQTLSVKVGTGCMSTSSRLKNQNVQVTVDQDRALITVSGGFVFHASASGIGTADCMGAKNVTLETDGVEPRRYSVAYKDEPLGTLDLLGDAETIDCLPTSRTGRWLSAATMNVAHFKDWAFDPDGAWKDWRGSSITALLEPILGNHPEGMEGRPEIAIEMSKARWNRMSFQKPPKSAANFIAIEIERHGFADDSVSGDRYLAAAIQTDGGWKISRLWSQQMCARGEFAGQWTAAPCP
ncbi:MAG: hypothetical protein ABJ239_08115 [Erythrobacter sp.]